MISTNRFFGVLFIFLRDLHHFRDFYLSLCAVSLKRLNYYEAFEFHLLIYGFFCLVAIH